MDPASAAVGDLEAVEARAGAVRRVAETRCQSSPRRDHGGQRSRSVAPCPEQGPGACAAQCLLRLAWDSEIDGSLTAQPAEPPYTDPYVRWCDRERGRPLTYVDPMLLDETCFFLAADFDKATWLDDAAAFLDTCRHMNLPAALERSRSGNGGHVWFFFNEAIPAVLARQLGAHILTETMERRPDIGLDSYDRFFPNQDTLPQGGFGNLIALPLQKRPRESSNSVFLDGRFASHPDQWEFLSSIRRISRREVEEIAHVAEAKGRIIGVRLALEDGEDDAVPWMIPPSRRRADPSIVGPLPETLELTLGNQIYIPKEVLPPALRNRLIWLAAFQNPEFYKAQAMRLPTYDKPRIIACAEDYPKNIGLPRGCEDDLLQTLSDLKIKPVIHEQRNPGQPLKVTFQG